MYLLVPLIFGLVLPLPAQAQPTEETQLRRIKTVLWPKAYAEQDTALLNQILADEFQMIDDQGKSFAKAEELDWITHHRISHDSFDYYIKRLDIWDNHTAIVAGMGRATGQNEEGGYQLQYYSSNVFIKREGRWQAVASHVSGVQKTQDD